VEKKKKECWMRTRKPLDEVAKERGSFGYADNQRLEHARDREVHAGLLAHPPLGRKARTVPRRHVYIDAPAPNWDDADFLRCRVSRLSDKQHHSNNGGRDDDRE